MKRTAVVKKERIKNTGVSDANGVVGKAVHRQPGRQAGARSRGTWYASHRSLDLIMDAIHFP